MPSEWLKIMLEEIARKQAEADEARLENERRCAEPAAGERTGAPARPPAAG